MMNVLLPEISYNPTRNEAAPAFNVEVEKEINKNTKVILIGDIHGSFHIYTNTYLFIVLMKSTCI